MATLIKKHDLIEARLARLSAIHGQDAGFYVLAVHSFIEGYLRDIFDPHFDRRLDKFGYFIDLFRDRKDPAGKSLCKGHDLLSVICNEHDLTHDVRHRFGELSPYDAGAATENLYGFLCLAGHANSGNLAKLREARDAWNDARSKADLVRELGAMGYKAQQAEKNLAERMIEIEALQAARKESEALSSLIARYEAELDQLRLSNKTQTAKADEARKAKFEAEKKLRKIATELDRLKGADDYLTRQRRLLGLSRSRKEYERFILKLTGEQRDVLSRIKLGGDFLVKGPAGTGKTLVLIKAIEKARGVDELDLAPLEGEILLLTYTKTLVKYDAYLSKLASEGRGAHRIRTADSFLEELLRLAAPSFRVVFDDGARYSKELASRHNGTELKDDELAAEIERLVYANAVTRAEYLDEGYERKGMGKPLGKEARAKVWQALESLEAEMLQTGRLMKGFAVKLVLESLDRLRADPRFPKLDYIFIDEVQDLSAAELKLLKACAGRCLVMAGDEDQAIFRPGFSFARSGIDIVGRSRSLGRNFRNSFPILELAEAYRAKMEGRDLDYSPTSDRPGDPPEFFLSEDKEELISLLVKRVELFRTEHRYEPENLFVIAPKNDDVAAILERLRSAGMTAKEPRDPSFDFEETGVVRVTTMHSAKGLDAPVVFLYLPYLPYGGANMSDEARDKIYRDLIYVSVTRAMDHLDVFVNPSAKYSAMKDLVETWELQRSES